MSVAAGASGGNGTLVLSARTESARSRVKLAPGVPRLMHDARSADDPRRQKKEMVAPMIRWWNAFTGLLERRRQGRIVARRLRTYVEAPAGH